MSKQKSFVALGASFVVVALSVTALAKDEDYNIETIAIPQAGVKVSADIATSCQPPQNQDLTTLIGDILSATLNSKSSSPDPSDFAMLGTVSMDTKCPSSAGAMTDIPDCKELDLEKFKGQNRQASMGLACELKKGEALNGEIYCLNKAIGDINANLDKFRESLAPMLTQAEKDVQTLESQIADRNKQGEAVGERIAKLKQAKEALQGIVNGPLYEQVRKNNEAVQRSADQKVRYEKMLKEYKMGLAMNCFENTPVPGMKCDTKDSADVPAVEGIACAYRESQLRFRSGKAMTKPTDAQKARAQRAEQAIRKTMKAIVAASSKRTSFPTLQELSQGSGGSATGTVKTPEDVLTQYGAALGGFGTVSGYSVKMLVDQQIKYCYNIAQQQIDDERKKGSGSALEEVATGIKRQDAIDSANMKSQMEALNAQYESAVKGLTGMSIRLETGGCMTASNKDQASCLQAMGNAITSLLNGRVTNIDKTPLTAVAMGVTGGKAPYTSFAQSVPDKPTDLANPSMAFKITCSGIDGCLAANESTERGLKSAIAAAQTQEKNYKTQINTTVKNRYAEYKTGLNKMNQAITAQVAKITASLSTIGAKTGVKTPGKVAQDEVSPGESGVFSTDDLDKLLNNLKYEENSFTDAQTDLTERTTEIQGKISEIKAALAKAEKAKATCDADAAKSQREEMADVCNNQCDRKDAASTLADLNDAINDIITKGKRECEKIRLEYEDKIAAVKDDRAAQEKLGNNQKTAVANCEKDVKDDKAKKEKERDKFENLTTGSDVMQKLCKRCEQISSSRINELVNKTGKMSTTSKGSGGFTSGGVDN